MRDAGRLPETMVPPDVRVALAPRLVFSSLVALALVLVSASAVSRYLRWFHVPQHSRMGQALLLFDVNLEHNFPAYYSALLLLLCALTLGLLGLLERRRTAAYWRRWFMLAALFLVLSMDEAIEFHGHLNPLVGRVFGTSGVLFYGWVLPAIIFLVGLGAYLFRFLAALPRDTAGLFVASGAIYVAGAVGFEMLAGLMMSNPDAAWSNPLTAAILEHTEELLEMLGLSVFLYALLRHVKLHHGGRVCIDLRLTGHEGRAGIPQVIPA